MIWLALTFLPIGLLIWGKRAREHTAADFSSATSLTKYRIGQVYIAESVYLCSWVEVETLMSVALKATRWRIEALSPK